MLPATPPGRCFPRGFMDSFAPTSQSSLPGALSCDLKTIMMLQNCSPRTLMSLVRRQLHERRARCVVLWRVFTRPSSPVFHRKPNLEYRTGSSSIPVAAKRLVFFRLSPAAAASAHTTAARLSSPLASSPCNPLFCSSTKPGSACRIPNPMMRVSATGIGWRPNASALCWARPHELSARCKGQRRSP